MEISSNILLVLLASMATAVFAQGGQNSTLPEHGEACKDKLSSEYCQMLKKNGACRISATRMMEMCQRTCHFCEEDCRDLLPVLCPWWEAHLACYTHPQVLDKYCRKSCKRCRAAAAPPKPKCASSEYGCCWDQKTNKGPKGECPKCEDRLRLCRQFRRDCFYGFNRPFMRENCPRTCRRC